MLSLDRTQSGAPSQPRRTGSSCVLVGKEGLLRSQGRRGIYGPNQTFEPATVPRRSFPKADVGCEGGSIVPATSAMRDEAPFHEVCKSMSRRVDALSGQIRLRPARGSP